MSTMASELIVDFHTQRDRSIWRMRSVQFADTSEMYIVVRHHDNQDVDRRDLWYNRTDYSRMRSAIQKSVRIVRAMASAEFLSVTLAIMAHPMTALLASSISSLNRVLSRSRNVEHDVSKRSFKNKQGKGRILLRPSDGILSQLLHMLRRGRQQLEHGSLASFTGTPSKAYFFEGCTQHGDTFRCYIDEKFEISINSYVDLELLPVVFR